MSTDNDDIAGLLGEQLARLFAKTVTREALVAAEQGSFDGALWSGIGDIGVIAALAPEAVGGAGLSWAQAAGLLQLLGSHLPPVPLGETMLAAWALGAAGIEAPAAPLAVAGGPLSLDAEGRVSGEDALVSWAPQAEAVVAIAQGAGARQLVLLSARDAELEPQKTLDRLPAARLRLRGAKPLHAVAAPAVLGDTGLLAPLAVLRALQLAGGLSQTLALAVDYANTRSQFGRTIGKFQAIQHQIAELAELTAAAQVAAVYAARQLDGGDAAAAERGAAVAKIRAGASATRGAAIAHQVFGAIGITDEHRLHYHTRRLWQWRDEAGSEGWWAERLGRQALAAGGAALWTGITASAP
ncbi:acyl-CoA dehydrogenase family protein [Solimonas soli]|uniref:acyl-CoA dehydrogenase family protein n=1 Tax=Solimonas soli TaxID=413479 RepID=UPI0004B2D334|nr:acyl-CoA dehydrogenase family protein [Solimonas soli]